MASTTQPNFDHAMMGIALRMAERGLGTTAPNPSVGAVIADETTGEVISRAVTAPGGRPHAEPLAIDAAGARAKGKTMYVTLEPCSHHGKTPPCSSAVIKAGLGRVVVALTDPDPRVAGRGLNQLRSAGIEVTKGIRADEAHWLTRGHIVRVTERRPFVQLKMALGPEGNVPRGKAGQPVFVTGPLARARGHLMRAMADAILIGHGTLRDDDPDLTCRLPGLAQRSPIRIVLASQLKKVAQSRLVATAREVPVHVVTAGSADPVEVGNLERAGVVVHRVRTVVGNKIWLPSLLERLAEIGITRLLVEGGPSLWRSFAHHGLFDEVVLFRARQSPDAAADAQQLSAELAAAELNREAGLCSLRLLERRDLGSDDMLVFRKPMHPTLATP
ncbi:MAG: bifunctional diaminohydroxyphosphoribosylaminopyrimidine deaminase/5-amino-6-(5-phosphoribosylamino)uracil reductase RibD [Hyphomicrobiaceae bacterium]|nr:bifunctional diaminohydroxyphosphoribosylaminopyrimidine deaminase/5-amino-6-(5-phosphoribosylamino)uracil reductase RibD [Hyphomicrobiaceae bacterium]MCC0010443.1 bifunctional diaminohydroxyphosphoribosylaminopyrimidine deaminase/5-amino-6-(5-phosphoribosylamino)uracil reductase RibD [Hyphomicrobiaceae bacterium]